MKIKELSATKERFTSGHRLCAGCGAGIVVRQVLMATDKPVVVCCPTGCLEVSSTIYPSTAWDTPYIHNAFENAAATLSGVESAYRFLRKKGRIDREIRFVAFGGDGGTYDIGLQALSGALERGHGMVYVCYDNGAYMNTGIQRSSATPRGAWTTTSPVGKVIPGKTQDRKDLTACVAAHDIPYVAQASPSHWRDLVTKARKAFEVDGPAFLNILSPCPRGWRYPGSQSIAVARLAVETCFWPLFEVEDGRWKLNYKPKEKKPLVEWLKPQGRFKHLFAPENEHIIEEQQAKVDKDWERLLRLCGEA
ncbi:MAG: thiamine pyrophosphate-dependent enzyme [Actinomycetota bacterium]|nr:thiamine pyrophosphate-dependent enzyme [Actinomycetota bacterium]